MAGIAFLIFWHRERTKNTFTATPVLTVRPSTDADISAIANIQHLIDFDTTVLDARTQVVNQMN